jgi:hypothetical protein
VSTGSDSRPWRRIDQVRPLRAWRNAELVAVTRVLQGGQQVWQDAWGLSASLACVTCANASEQDLEAACQLAGEAGGASAWIAWPAGFEAELARELWGGDSLVGPIATRITRACRADMPLRLCAALQMQTAAPSASQRPRACAAWSGLVQARLAFGARLLLDAAAVERLGAADTPEPARHASAARAPLAPVTSAIAALRLPLRVRLADCELDLASLQDLRIGDIVPLPHRLDAPLLVRDAQEEVVLAGYLARQGGRKALELARPANPPH